MHLARISGIASALSSFAVVIACSGTASSTDDPTTFDPSTAKPAKPAASGSDAAPDAPATPAPSGSNGTLPDGPDAAANSGALACLQGCVEQNSQGAKEFSDILVPCACASSVCKSVCSACTSSSDPSAQELLGSASDACRTCVKNSLGSGAACNKAEQKECIKHSHCPGFALCAQSCQ